MSMLLSGEQVRAARAIARIEQADLARRCGLSVETIKRLERIRGPIDANVKTLRAITDAFLRLGVAFGSADEGGLGVWLVGQAPEHSPANISLRYLSERRGQPLYRLTYFSTAVPMSDSEMLSVLHDIVRASAPRNNALEVTGVLLACNGRFLQALEGSKAAVLQVYGAICTDRRHSDLHVVESTPIAARRFADWNLCSKLLHPEDQVVVSEPTMARGFEPANLSSAGAVDLLSVVALNAGGRREALRA